MFKDTLLNIYCCFINFGVIVNSTIVHAWVNPKICFLHKAYHILLVLRVITLHREPFFNLKKKKRHNNMKNLALNSWWKEFLFSLWELKQEGGVMPCSSSPGDVHIYLVTWIFSCSESICRWLKNVVRIDLGVTNEFEWVGEFASKVFANNEAQLHYEAWGDSFSGNH